MRRSAVALVVLALAASTAQGAQAKQACPTLTDDAGDTNVLGFQVQQDTSDITSASVSTANKTLTAKVTVVGQPVNNEPGVSRLYDIYFDNGEGDFVLRGTLGNGENLFQLVTHTQLADAGPGVGTADHWQAGKTLQGRVHDHTVTISAPLDRDLPLLGRRVHVSASTWIATANDLSVGGTRTPDGVAMGVDVSEARDFRAGDRGCT